MKTLIARKKPWTIVAMLGAAWTLVGCGGEAPDEQLGVTVVQSALDSNYAGPFQWNQGFVGPLQLMPTATHFCWLSRVSGNFRGGGESVHVVNHNDNYWYIEGSSQQQGVSASAECVRYSRFTAPSPTSFYFWNYYADASVSTSWDLFLGTQRWAGYNAYSIKTGDYVSMLQGISGDFAGAGEWASISQSSDANTPSALAVYVNSSWVRGYATSFFAGNPSLYKAAKFIGPSGVGTAGQAGHYWASAGNPAYMASTNSAICVFATLQGNFRGSGEWAEIVPVIDSQGQEVWALRTGSQQDGIWAAAQCYAFDQR